MQHAYNPVEWYPWSKEALSIAKKEDKPILVSIGYSACHWCHVMEHESFEDEATAAIMNAHFINIKIDREERPDLDHIYMEAVQAIAGNGGWPLNVFLTPDGKPFYGGTYFPPRAAFNRSSWTDVLHAIHKLFIEKRKDVEEKAEELTQFVSKGLPFINREEIILSDRDPIIESQEIYSQIIKQADKVWGGFGDAPKFPQTFAINNLFHYYFFSKNDDALNHACLSLDKMIMGGIYDQIGGGFSRYSTDNEWLAPHFEKMLYDNALLIYSLSIGFQVTRNDSYKEIVQQTVGFLRRELMDVNGGFYSALDADSEGKEGKYYVWDYDEILILLGDDAELFCRFYDVTKDGNWEGTNILRILKTSEEFCKTNGLKPDDFYKIIGRCKKILFDKRGQRVRPGTDDKIILSWNALAITALCKASSAFKNSSYLELAINTFEFIINKFKPDKASWLLFHNYKNEKASNLAFLDDYSFFIHASLSLFECTSDIKFLTIAEECTNYVLDHFSSEDLFYFTSDLQDDIIVRKKEVYDSAIPSGNAVMNANLFSLGILLNKPEWSKISNDNLGRVTKLVKNYPTSFGVWVKLFLDSIYGSREVTIIGETNEQVKKDILSYYIPGLIIQTGEDNLNMNFPLLNGKNRLKGKTGIYICKNYQCDLPVYDVNEAIKKLLN